MKTTSLSRSSDPSPQSAAACVRHRVSQNHKTRHWLAAAALILALTGSAPAQVPQLINYQGRVAVGGVNFEGTGRFKFALVNADAPPAIYWLNSADTTPEDGIPDAAVELTVTKGLYSVLLGENMTAIPAAVWTHPDVRLRVWFDDGTANGSQLLSPDQRIAAVGYAMMAGNVPDAAITSAKLAAGAVGATNIAAGAVGTNQLAAGAVTGTKLADGAVGADKMLQAREIASSLVVANPTVAGGGAFGTSIATVGTDRVLIGDPNVIFPSEEEPSIGAAYLLDSAGNLITTIPNPNSDPRFEQFGKAVAGLGTDKVIIGAPEFDAGGPIVGAAYLFSTNGNKLAYIENPTPNSDDLFGSSVAGVGDDRMLVGAPGDTGGVGAVYLFNTAIPPEVVTTFTNPAPATYDAFGQSAAAVDAGRVLIGAHGAAYLFNTDGTLLTTFTNPTAVISDQFGYALAAVGTDRVLVGAWGADSGATDAGAAYLFSTDGTLLATFTKPSPAANDRFGWSVAAVGTDRVLIGAYRDDTGAPNAGTAYLFRTDGTLLNTIHNPAPAAGDDFGAAVAAAGSDRLVIGAPGEDSAHFYQLGAPYVPGLIADGLRAGSITSTMFAPGSVKAAAIDGGAVTTAKLADGAVTVDKVFHQLEVVASNTITNPCVDGIFFGYAVAAAGAERVLISDPEAIFWEDPENPSLSVTGAAYLYDLAGNLMTTIMNPAPFQPSGSHDGFGLVLAAVGLDKVVIGAPWFPHMSERSGAAYLFDHNGNQLAFFEKPTPQVEDSFGSSVAAVGADRVLIGAPGDSNYVGAAYLFDLAGTLVTTFTNPAPATSDSFGIAVAALGTNRVVIGASGAAYLFDLAGNLITSFTDPVTQYGSGFGKSLAAVGDNRVLIGASEDNTTAPLAGTAYLFSTNGTLLATFANPTPAAEDKFGSSLAAVGSQWVVIGAYRDDTGALNAGAAYLFRTDGTHVGTLTSPTPAANASFGFCVAAAADDRVLIGAFDHDRGTAYLFTLDSFIPGFIAAGVRPGSVDAAGLAVGAVQSGNIASGAVGSTQIADGAIGSTQLDPNIGLWTASGADVYRGGTGKVGIGTDDPTTALDVAGTVTAMAFSGDGTGLTGVPVGAGAVGSIQLADNAVQSGNIAAGAVGSSQLDPSIGLWTASGEDVYRGGTGNVGIGTDDPTTKLDVAGTVKATAFTGDGAGLANISASAVVTAPSAPAPGNAGNVYFNSADKCLYYSDGSRWLPAGNSQAVYRWATWSTYNEGLGWFFNNSDPDLTGGVTPQKWSDAYGMASEISPDKKVQGAMFNKKATISPNSVVWSETWLAYSTTNSKFAGALFRVRNKTDAPIDWTMEYYATAYGVCEERASIALNGVNVWNTTGDSSASSNYSLVMSIPANRISTVICVAAASPRHSIGSTSICVRSTVLAFRNNCLTLPAGLEFVDDLDTATRGYEQ